MQLLHIGGEIQLCKPSKLPDLALMKTMQYILTILFLSSITAFGQGTINWKTQKSMAFKQAGINTVGHESFFSTQVFKNKNQFIELAGGAGTFFPANYQAQTFSSGLTFNKGNQKHFLSIGLQMTYATNEVIELYSVLNQESYLSNALIGYYYSVEKINFKLHFQPLSGISNRITNLGSSASISIQL